MLQAGFGRLDITPPLGTTLAGYYETRYADGILDPLLATAVLFDNGEKKALVMSIDLIGFNQFLMDRIRTTIAERMGMDKEGVFLACTHTHLGPCTASSRGNVENEDYIDWLEKKLGDAAQLAMNDLAPVTQKLYTYGRVQDVAFVRRYWMKDGTVRTNPGQDNPDIVKPAGEPDERSSLFLLKRENAPEIAIINFQVHPDVIGGKTISADFPHFVRDTYESIIPNSRCVYFNGCQGDTNHCDFMGIPKPQKLGGYDRSEYMGKKIAMSVISNLHLAKELPGEAIAYGQKTITLSINKARPEEIEDALAINAVFEKQGRAAASAFAKTCKTVTSSTRGISIVGLMNLPDEQPAPLTALSVGDAVFAGFPGEPFTDIGREVKSKSKFTLTIPCCCANGYEGYYPMDHCFDEGGYESSNAKFCRGTAEKLITTSLEIINKL